MQIDFRAPSTTLLAFENEANTSRPVREKISLLVFGMPLAAEVPDVLEAVHVPHARDKQEPNQSQYVVPARFRHMNAWY